MGQHFGLRFVAMVNKSNGKYPLNMDGFLNALYP